MKLNSGWVIRAIVGCLAICVIVTRQFVKEPSKGLPVVPGQWTDCVGLSRPIIVHLGGDGVIQLNYAERLSANGLASRLNELMRTRTMKLVFVSAAPEVPFNLVAGLIDRVKQDADSVALLTPLAEGPKNPRCVDASIPESHLNGSAVHGK
jgi:biopolymer transport protein ExbD